MRSIALLKMEIYCIDYNIPHNAAIKIPSGFNWYSFQEVKNLAMPSLMKKIFKFLMFPQKMSFYGKLKMRRTSHS